MKKAIAFLLSAVLILTALSALSVFAAAETTITVTRAEHSAAFEHEFEIDYHFTGLDNPKLCSDAWVGVYPTSLVEEVLAGKNEFKGHSYGSWCDIAGDNVQHGGSLSLGAEADVSHTSGTWGNMYVINEGAVNASIWGGPLDTSTEYKAVLFRCDTEGYEIVAISNAFRFTEATVEESEEFKALKTLADKLGTKVNADNYADMKIAVELAIKGYGSLSDLEASLFPEELYDKINAANLALKQYEDSLKETEAPSTTAAPEETEPAGTDVKETTPADETKAAEESKTADESKTAEETKTAEEAKTTEESKTADESKPSEETKAAEKKGCGSSVASLVLLPILLGAAILRKKN